MSGEEHGDASPSHPFNAGTDAPALFYPYAINHMFGRTQRLPNVNASNSGDRHDLVLDDLTEFQTRAHDHERDDVIGPKYHCDKRALVHCGECVAYAPGRVRLHGYANIGPSRESHREWIDDHSEANYVFFLQSFESLTNGGFGNANLPTDFPIALTAVSLQQFDDLFVDVVNQGASILSVPYSAAYFTTSKARRLSTRSMPFTLPSPLSRSLTRSSRLRAFS